jgi:hypothetical protein
MNLNVGNCKVDIENELLEKHDFEGMLINPLEPQLGILVMSSKDDSFTLHIYKLQSQDENEYHIVKELTTKTFSNLVGMQYFLNTFSTYKAEDFIDFLNEFDTQTH